MTDTDIRELDPWIELLSQANIPILNSSFDSVKNAAGNSKQGSQSVTDAILKDASLTLQVLRIANSQNAGSNVNTVSAAVETIGVDGVLGLCVSVMRLDSLKGHPQQQHLYRQLVKAYLASVQTRHLVTLTDNEWTEELCVASLLLHLAELCFWSRINSQSARFHDLLEKKQLDSLQIEEDLLGTQFRDISRGLCDKWQITGLLCTALESPISPPKPVEALLLGDEVSVAIVDKGWQSNECTDVVSTLCSNVGVGLNKAKEILGNACSETIEDLSRIGIDDADSIIPLS